MSDYYVGLISGTSMDGIDAVLVQFDTASVEVLATHDAPYPDSLRAELLAAARLPLDIELDVSGELNRRTGECFRDAALQVIAASGIDKANIKAIGSHGQTLRHQPDIEQPFSLQIADPDIIAAGCAITTVANFRSADIEAGGQGAPLVPPFHEWLFGSPDVGRVVVNIGGIANITHLPGDGSDVTGFDTGPGNGLMDAWTAQHRNKPYDLNGDWAGSGKVIDSLLNDMLADPYLNMLPPKSTGFEYFNPDWLQQFEIDQLAAADVQATLCEFTAVAIANDVKLYCAGASEIFICGGGVHNADLLNRLRRNLPGLLISSTSVVGLDPDWVEAVAFAWLAMRTLNGETGNLPSVTGASHKVVLGDIHLP